MVICGVVILLLCAMGVLAATDPNRRRGRPGVTLDTEYNIQPVTRRPRQPATPSRHATQVINTAGMSPGYVPPSASIGVAGQPTTRIPVAKVTWITPPQQRGGLVRSDGRPEPAVAPQSPSGVSGPYVAPVPTQSSKVHDRHHCPGCMCGR